MNPGRFRVLVGAVIVQHHMQLSAWVAPRDQLEEGQELAVAMPVKAAAGDLASGDLQRGEQAGDAVAHVVVGAPLGQPRTQRQCGGGAVQRLDLGLLIHTEHDRAGGWLQVEPAGIGDLGQQLGIGRELEGLQAVRGQVMVGSDPGHGHAAHLEVLGQGAGRPVGDGKVGGRAGEGDGDDLSAASILMVPGRPERG
jgi:hypothetical protein